MKVRITKAPKFKKYQALTTSGQVDSMLDDPFGNAIQGMDQLTAFQGAANFPEAKGTVFSNETSYPNPNAQQPIYMDLESEPATQVESVKDPSLQGKVKEKGQSKLGKGIRKFAKSQMGMEAYMRRQNTKDLVTNMLNTESKKDLDARAVKGFHLGQPLMAATQGTFDPNSMNNFTPGMLNTVPSTGDFAAAPYMPISAYGGQFMAYGGRVYNQVAPNALPDRTSEPRVSVSNTLQPVPRELANIEAEKDETIYFLNNGGLPAHYKIGGKPHSQGGTPLNVPEDSFVFSKALKMKDKRMFPYFDINKPTSFSDIAKKYDINKYRKVLADPDTDKLQKDTAEKMIANYNLKLGMLALAQESTKGFPQGLPMIAAPFTTVNALDPQMILPTPSQGVRERAAEQEMSEEQMMEQPMAKFGGYLSNSSLSRFVYGGKIKRYQSETTPGQYVPDVPTREEFFSNPELNQWLDELNYRRNVQEQDFGDLMYKEYLKINGLDPNTPYQQQREGYLEWNKTPDFKQRLSDIERQNPPKDYFPKEGDWDPASKHLYDQFFDRNETPQDRSTLKHYEMKKLTDTPEYQNSPWEERYRMQDEYKNTDQYKKNLEKSKSMSPGERYQQRYDDWCPCQKQKVEIIANVPVVKNVCVPCEQAKLGGSMKFGGAMKVRIKSLPSYQSYTTQGDVSGDMLSDAGLADASQPVYTTPPANIPVPAANVVIPAAPAAPAAPVVATPPAFMTMPDGTVINTATGQPVKPKKPAAPAKTTANKKSTSSGSSSGNFNVDVMEGNPDFWTAYTGLTQSGKIKPELAIGFESAKERERKSKQKLRTGTKNVYGDRDIHKGELFDDFKKRQSWYFKDKPNWNYDSVADVKDFQKKYCERAAAFGIKGCYFNTKDIKDEKGRIIEGTTFDGLYGEHTFNAPGFNEAEPTTTPTQTPTPTPDPEPDPDPINTVPLDVAEDYARRSGYFPQDIINIGAAAAQRIPVPDTWYAPLQFKGIDPAYLVPDYSPIMEAANISTQGINAYGSRQGADASLALIQGKAARPAAEHNLAVANVNAGIYNNAQQINSQIANQNAMYNAQLAQADFDANALYEVDRIKAQNKKRADLARLINTAITNRATAETLSDAFSEHFYIDPTRGGHIKFFKGSPFIPNEKADMSDIEALDAQLTKLKYSPEDKKEILKAALASKYATRSKSNSYLPDYSQLMYPFNMQQDI